MSHYVESTINRSNRLKCFDCKKKIKMGDEVVFKLFEESCKMEVVYCPECSINYEIEVIETETHPNDID